MFGKWFKQLQGDSLQSTINQTYYAGNCTINFEGKTSVLKNDIFELPPESSCRVSHGGWDYCILPGQKGRIFVKKSFGNWHEIAAFYGMSGQSAKIFTCVLDNHQGCYAYMVTPSDKSSRKAFSSVDILSRTEECQAVKQKNNNLISAIFYKPGLLHLDAYCDFIAVTPALFILRPYKDGWKITMSDPTQQLKAIVFEISGKYSGGVYIPKENRTRFTVGCPQGKYAGSGVSITLQLWI